jgi:hypothetical protein
MKIKKAIVLATMLVLAFALALQAPCVGQPLVNRTTIITGHGTLENLSTLEIVRFSIAVTRHDRGVATPISRPNIYGSLIIGDDVYYVTSAPVECDYDDGNYISGTPVGSGNPMTPSAGGIGAVVYYGDPGDIPPDAGLQIVGGDIFALESGSISCRFVEK